MVNGIVTDEHARMDAANVGMTLTPRMRDTPVTYAQPRDWSYACSEAPGPAPHDPEQPARPWTSPPGAPDVPGERQVALPADPHSARAAREFTTATLREWHLDSLIDVAVLIASELVTNAIRYGGAAPGYGDTDDDAASQDSLAAEPVHLAWHRHASRVTCIVTDGNPSPPVLRPAELDAESGRGLQVVQALAAAWGLLPLGPAHKAVWAALQVSVDL